LKKTILKTEAILDKIQVGCLWMEGPKGTQRRMIVRVKGRRKKEEEKEEKEEKERRKRKKKTFSSRERSRRPAKFKRLK